MEAINEFYLEDGHLEQVSSYISDSKSNGKVIYEVLKVKEGVAIFSEEHIKRFERSFTLMDKVFAYKYEKINEYIMRLIEANKVKNGNVKITFNLLSDTMRVYSIKHSYPNDDMYKNGVYTIIYNGERQNPNIKVVDLKFREKVNEEIKNNNAYEAILIDRNGYITEGSKSNIFIIKDDVLLTSPIIDVLPGVTREKVINISKKVGINFEEKRVNISELEEIDAMFITGTSPNILPIAEANNKKFNVKNVIMRELMKNFDEEMEKYIAAFHKKVKSV